MQTAAVTKMLTGLKVLYLSRYTDTTLIKDGQMDPTLELLQTPFSANALKRRIREVLDGK